MGGGEYTSVQAQRDSQEALLNAQRAELVAVPAEELDELAHLYMQKGLSLRLARGVAAELTKRDGAGCSRRSRTWHRRGRPCQAMGSLTRIHAFISGRRRAVAGRHSAATAHLSHPSLCRRGTAWTWAHGLLRRVTWTGPAGRATLRNILVGSATMAVTYALGSIVRAV